MSFKFRKYVLLRPLFVVRDYLWTKLGIFQVKKKFKQKLFFKRAAREDEQRRKQFSKRIMALPNDMFPRLDGESVIVSMTSYGNRLEQTCPYAIYSLLTQKHLPNRIILNIDQSIWNEDSIPSLIKKLRQVGVEVNFTEDIGPHTKLLPTLHLYPDDIIITVDDDVLYDDTMIEELYNEYLQSDRKSVICREGKSLLKEKGKFLPYSQQPHIRECIYSPYKMAFGVAGVLYPPHLFGEEVFNTKVIRELCPKADDIWFGVMELYYKIPVVYVSNNSWTGDADVDRNEEYNQTQSGALHFLNDLKGYNDIQWESLLQHYHLS